MTYAEAFEKIKKKENKIDLKKATKDVAIQVNLIDEDCHGAFYIQLKNNELFVEPYDYIDNDAFVDVSFKDMIDILDSKADYKSAYTEGRIIIGGNLEAVTYLLGLIKKPVKRITKKTTSKKATVSKKETAAKKPAAKTSTAAKTETVKPEPKKETVKKTTTKTTVAAKAEEVKPEPKKETAKKTTKDVKNK